MKSPIFKYATKSLNKNARTAGQYFIPLAIKLLPHYFFSSLISTAL